MKINKIEIFCGTGGVGKTTLATSRALFLAKKDQKVLLMTIDPSKRLKQILNIHESKTGEIQNISCHLFEPDKKENQYSFDAILAIPSTTIKRIIKPNGTQNPILHILSQPYAGMNEIMAIIELHYYFSKNIYDVIILDTPPGKHFIHFLHSAQKISKFFNPRFIYIFQLFKKSIQKISPHSSKTKISPLVIGGFKKLFHHLEKVTGNYFIDEFIDTILTLYNHKNAFLTPLTFQKLLRDPNYSHWFLVTSIEQQKIFEAKEIKKEAEKLFHGNMTLIVNKCLEEYLNQWTCPEHEYDLLQLKQSIQKVENKIKNQAKQDFDHVIEFPEILSNDVQQHINVLTQYWS